MSHVGPVAAGIVSGGCWEALIEARPGQPTDFAPLTVRWMEGEKQPTW